MAAILEFTVGKEKYGKSLYIMESLKKRLRSQRGEQVRVNISHQVTLCWGTGGGEASH